MGFFVVGENVKCYYYVVDGGKVGYDFGRDVGCVKVCFCL